MLEDCLKHEDNDRSISTINYSDQADSSARPSDIARAWEILQRPSQDKPEYIDGLARLLDELRIDLVDSLNDIDESDYDDDC